MDRRQFLGAGASLVAGTSLFESTAFAQQQTTIAIATGGTGGVYYPLGGGMANVLTKYVPGYAATAGNSVAFTGRKRKISDDSSRVISASAVLQS